MAYEMGARVFDTAAAYGAGNAELILGRALRDRDDAVVVTKVGYSGDPVTRQMAPEDASPTAIRRSVENSLKRLDRERIDIVLLHINEYPVEKAARVFDTVGHLRNEGKILGFGWSTDHPERLAPYAGREGFVAVENDYNVFQPATEVMAIAERERLVSLSRLPLAMGLLTGKYRPGQKLRSRRRSRRRCRVAAVFQAGGAEPGLPRAARRHPRPAAKRRPLAGAGCTGLDPRQVSGCAAGARLHQARADRGQSRRARQGAAIGRDDGRDRSVS